MVLGLSQFGALTILEMPFEKAKCCTVADCEREIARLRCNEALLQEALARDEKLLHQKDEAINYQSLVSKESDHRLLNEMQMVASLLSMQSRTSSNAETTEQLIVAANRVSMIARIHRLLHSFDGMQTVGFRQFLEEYCREFSEMLSLDEDLKRVVIADGIEIELPTATAVPLAFIASELLTNAAKYGEGQIGVRLESGPEKGYLLSLSNEGPALPHGFNPASGKGLGMKIIRGTSKNIHLRHFVRV